MTLALDIPICTYMIAFCRSNYFQTGVCVCAVNILFFLVIIYTWKYETMNKVLLPSTPTVLNIVEVKRKKC